MTRACEATEIACVPRTSSAAPPPDVDLLSGNRDKLDTLVQALRAHEALDEASAAAGVERHA